MGPFWRLFIRIQSEDSQGHFLTGESLQNSCQGEVSTDQNQNRKKSKSFLNRAVCGPLDRRKISVTDENRVDFCHHLLKMFIGSFVEPLNRNKS